MRETEMHLFAGVGTILVCALVAAPAMLLGGKKANAGPEINLAEMESIEAELAMKSEEKEKQPQKEKRAPDPVVDETIGGDANAKAETCKTDADCPAGKVCKKAACVKKDKANPDDPLPDLTQFDHKTDDVDVGEPTPVKLGSFDGSEFGWAPTNKGDPFYVELIRDLRENWEYPTLSSDEGVPIGCLRIEVTGKISDTLFKEKSGNAELDDSVERAMTALSKLRNDNPIEVPTHLLSQGVTTKWLCIRFKPKAS